MTTRSSVNRPRSRSSSVPGPRPRWPRSPPPDRATYVRGPDLVDRGGSLEAWSVPAAVADPDAVRRLADAFDVSGDLRQIDGGWRIGADGEPSIRVASFPGARWDYLPGGPPQVSTACAVPTTTVPGSTTASDLPLVGPGPDTSQSSGDVGVDGCTSTPAPEGVPTAARSGGSSARPVAPGRRRRRAHGGARHIGCVGRAGGRVPRARRDADGRGRHRGLVRRPGRGHLGFGVAGSAQHAAMPTRSSASTRRSAA